MFIALPIVIHSIMFDLGFFYVVRRVLGFLTVPCLKFKFKHEAVIEKKRTGGGGKAIKYQPYEQADQILQDYVVDTYPVYFGLKMHIPTHNNVFFEHYDCI